jgi:sugar fermentation stimulation protein A
MYTNTCEGVFISRPNRFMAQIDLDNIIVMAHVKNTGRCKELLIPGVKVVLQKADQTERKTKYDLIAVWKNNQQLINIDSSAPNKVFLEYLQAGQYIEGITFIKPEVKHGNSRFDFYIETDTRKIFIEIKGVTLEKNGVAMFPDAPTIRGVKHLNELIMCTKEGYEAQVVFVIQMKAVHYFMPNNKTHPAFGEALVVAKKAGVAITAMDCIVTESKIVIDSSVPVKLL